MSLIKISPGNPFPVRFVRFETDVSEIIKSSLGFEVTALMYRLV